MTHKDKDLFLEEMRDVVPLPASNDAPVLTKKQESMPGIERRRVAAMGLNGDTNPLSFPDAVEQVGPLDIVGHRKNGVQEGVYRKLRLGKYEAAAKLDLHRIKLRDARDLVQKFLKIAVSGNQRTVLITHGKGIHSDTPGLMKSYVMHWLKESDLVLAWHSAQARHGGTGATYVLVRKSGEARQQNRENFSRGS
ncbi:MAG: DNA endonuclease SmrA [Alcanivoracaceae bacterium]|nr:DNA endonuclease SmrA [Alcanivoracaceae bacterium]